MKHPAFLTCLMSSTLVALAAVSSAAAGEQVPFRGTFLGQTVSAEPAGPGVVFVVTEGAGRATHLGRYTMISPHFSHLNTGFAEGQQIFTAANGDSVTADFAGFFQPTPDGLLVGELHATITGGTGRFEGASGSYFFDILFDPATFTSVAVIDGTISSPGAAK
jgi:hypothetical protein